MTTHAVVGPPTVVLLTARMVDGNGFRQRDRCPECGRVLSWSQGVTARKIWDKADCDMKRGFWHINLPNVDLCELCTS